MSDILGLIDIKLSFFSAEPEIAMFFWLNVDFNPSVHTFHSQEVVFRTHFNI